MDRYVRLFLPALLLAFTVVLGLPGQAPAQTYPARPIHLVTGNPPGGATDFTARAIGQPLGVRLGQGVVIDNRPGANGNISAEVVAKAVPDGYTLLYANDSLMVVNPHIYSKMSVNLMQDLVPVVTTISNQLVLAVNPQVIPVNDFPAFVEFARKPATSLFYASIGNGSQHHLAMELLKQHVGMDLIHVPYRGGAAAAIGLVAGEVTAMFGGGSLVPTVHDGKVRGVASAGKVRNPATPELPTINEIYPGYEALIWQGLFVPAGTPQFIIDRLRAELRVILAQPEIAKRLGDAGAGEPYITTPDEFAARIKSDYEKYGKLIRSIGLKVE